MRERLERELEEFRQAEKDRESELAAFYAGQVAVERAEEALAAAQADLGDVVAKLVTREGSVSAVADIIGVPRTQLRRLIEIHESRDRRPEDAADSPGGDEAKPDAPSPEGAGVESAPQQDGVGTADQSPPEGGPDDRRDLERPLENAVGMP